MKKQPEKHTEERPWGRFEQFTANRKSTIKIITINPGETLSLQYHNLRDEFWHILQGEPIITIGQDEIVKLARPGDEFFIPRKTIHRIGAPPNTQLVKFLEIAFGKFDEEDIVRLADNYNRAGV
ncbi:MAG: mannose-6-phosphate isomerase [Candidatus Magasanikbacteria bacterium RIFCSPHIGHO2_01_FULL_47_8]|uniref:Mannose-6-phosphate isomerase n=1 Tax=Candidatus Magasanikbacteria bacterium RIFCSPHIGHO2_01_FULL_47_8 TaxID=1798673 RepID=A0A1F6MDQ9_9BACT|nr:MAG: mannose-6-phosphate isomerase [Candidatus Magasanikbacteria bacterium RIFCSPHIGHO2_01_FULL_47_8]